jgi:hypothetical protein
LVVEGESITDYTRGATMFTSFTLKVIFWLWTDRVCSMYLSFFQFLSLKVCRFDRRFRVYDISDYGETIKTYKRTEKSEVLDEMILAGKGALR